MQEAIIKLIAMGPIPSYADATEEILNEYGRLLDLIERPVTDEEAAELVQLFSPDDAGEINWTIIHIVETAPNWPPKLLLRELEARQPHSVSIDDLIRRLKNAELWD